MLALHGTRTYGHLYECDGQYIATRFAHVGTLPLIPLGSFWVTGEEAGRPSGIGLGLNAPSALAGYVRTWGIVLGLLAFVVGVYLAGIALALAYLASWGWYFAPGRQRVRQRLFGRATGVSVDPRFLPKEEVARLVARARERWVARYGDLARLAELSPGDPDAEKVALGYALLRGEARLSGSAEAQARAEAICLAQAERLGGRKRAADVVMDGSRAAFSEVRGAPGKLVPIAWYSPEGWSGMRLASPDRDALHATYGEWLADAEAAVRRLAAEGAEVHRVEVDVQRLLAFASGMRREPDRRVRARFTLDEAERARAGTGRKVA